MSALRESKADLERYEAEDEDGRPGVYAAVAARALGVHLVLRYPDGRVAHHGAGNQPTVWLTIGAGSRTTQVGR